MLKPIFSFIVIILSVSFAFLYIKPLYNLAQERRDNLATLAGIFKDADKIKASISKTEETLNSIDSTMLARFAVFLPETSDPIRLANNLQRMGISNGIMLENIKVEKTANDSQKSAGLGGGGILQGAASIFSADTGTAKSNDTTADTGGKKFITTKANFSFVATSEAFRNFLYDTEKSLGLINVTALSFTPIQVAADIKKTKQEAPIIYQYTVAIETYALK